MKFDKSPDFIASCRNLHDRGGAYKKAADKVLVILAKMDHPEAGFPLEGLRITNNGESRIKHCVKYDLTEFCRLITIQDNGLCYLAFVGTHDESDEWLEKNKGMTLAVDKNRSIKPVYQSSQLDNKNYRIHSESDWSNGPLYKKISKHYLNHITKDLKSSYIKALETLTSISSDEEILELAFEIEDVKLRDVIFDVFIHLKNGNIDGAKDRIDLFTNTLVTLENLSLDDIEKIVDGEYSISFREYEAELIKQYMKLANFQQWMLFLHPEQRKIVELDYDGPAKLSGVSGSGKTCVLIKRALRLARKYPQGQILILTLNKSLAALIKNLVNYADVKPEFDSCRQKLAY